MIGFGPATRAIACVVGLGALAACGIGDGEGQVSGFVFVRYCKGVQHDLGSAAEPTPYDMNPAFFVGEPIEDLLGRNNSLLIRVQRDGKRLEVNDALVFDVLSVYEVARCVRGRMNDDGTPDWDVRTCDRSTGVPRVKVGPHEPVRVALTLFYTCSQLPTVGVGVPGEGKVGSVWESWIEFADFGSAGKHTEPVDPDFKVSFGERLHAERFHLTLEDDRVVKAREAGIAGTESGMSGLLDGFFDFDLRRGRAGQAFP